MNNRNRKGWREGDFQLLGFPNYFRTPEGLCHWILSPAPIIGLDP